MKAIVKAEMSMTAKTENIVIVGPDELASARAKVTPELLAWRDTLTDADIAAQIAANPDAAPELDDVWFARARWLTPSTVARLS